jgi:hypothetical protein
MKCSQIDFFRHSKAVSRHKPIEVLEAAMMHNQLSQLRAVDVASWPCARSMTDTLALSAILYRSHVNEAYLWHRATRLKGILYLILLVQDLTRQCFELHFTTLSSPNSTAVHVCDARFSSLLSRCMSSAGADARQPLLCELSGLP